MNEGESAKDRRVFAETQPNVRKRFWRCIASETSRCFCGVRDEARAASEEGDDYSKCRARMAKHLNSKQSAANRPNNSVNCVPGGIDPGNFVGEKFKKIENARNRNNHWMAQHFERLVGRRECDPVEVDGETSGKNREIKVDAGEAGKPERDAEKIKLLHVEKYAA